ncbi:MAG: hypothetical protein R2789_19115 [Microthrixaceae bacterium]
METVTDDRPPAQPGDLRFTEVVAEAGLDEAHSIWVRGGFVDDLGGSGG